jgi:hypothetical protein
MKKRWSNQKEREKMIASLENSWTDSRRLDASEHNSSKRPEVRTKIGKIVKDRWSDPDYKKNHSGENNPRYGKKPSPETKRNMSIAQKKRYLDENEHKRVSDQLKVACETRWSDPNERIKMSGKNSRWWKGGTSFEPYCPKFNREFKDRVRSFFNYTCLLCGTTQEKNGKKLSVHHVEYNKQTCCDESYPMFAPLCSRCHNKTNRERERWQYMLGYIIQEMYNGESFIHKNAVT